jgi:hypothetical protein
MPVQRARFGRVDHCFRVNTGILNFVDPTDVNPEGFHGA